MSVLNLTAMITPATAVRSSHMTDLLGDSSASHVGPSFADVLKQLVNDVSRLNEEARDAISAFVRGEDVELHQVMAAVEEAGLSLQMLVEIKNRFIDAYRTVVNMQ